MPSTAISPPFGSMHSSRAGSIRPRAISDAAQADDVGVGLEDEVVADPDGRHDQAELRRDLAADQPDPLDEAAAAAAPVDEADEAVADL